MTALLTVCLRADLKENFSSIDTLYCGHRGVADPSLEWSHFGIAPPWVVQLLGAAPIAARIPIAIAGQNYGSIVIETDPKNEILEVWNDLGDSLFVLSLFFGLNILLIYFFIGRALRPLDRP